MLDASACGRHESVSGASNVGLGQRKPPSLVTISYEVALLRRPEADAFRDLRAVTDPHTCADP
jgi:hypothetical protein